MGIWAGTGPGPNQYKEFIQTDRLWDDISSLRDRNEGIAGIQKLGMSFTDRSEASSCPMGGFLGPHGLQTTTTKLGRQRCEVSSSNTFNATIVQDLTRCRKLQFCGGFNVYVITNLCSTVFMPRHLLAHNPATSTARKRL